MTPAAEWQPKTRSVAAWAIYDLANTIFALGVGSLYFAEWLTDNDTPDLALAVAINAAMIVVIVLGPWIGARSDHRGRRRPYLLPATLLAVVPTFFLATPGVTGSLVLFSIALIGFNLGSVVYDAMLPDVSTPQNRGFVSGMGVAVGYIGSFIAVAVGLLFLDSLGHSGVFKIIAVLFVLFALPTFFLVEERPKVRQDGPAPSLASSVQRLVNAWRHTRHYEGVTRFLIGRFFYTDAVNTLIGGFLTIFVIEELGFTDTEVQVLLGMAIVGAMAGAWFGGRLVDLSGPRRLLHMAIHTWIVAIGLGIVAAEADLVWLAWILGAIGGLALGATWTADRVYMARISPPEQLGEFYGLYATVGRFATILGPLVWGLLVTVLGLSRSWAMGALIVFLVIGRVILEGVNDEVRAWGA